MNNYNLYSLFESVNNKKPKYWAMLKGSPNYPKIVGMVMFFEKEEGFWIAVNVAGLPVSDEPCTPPFFGFHIHEGGNCKGNEEKTFANVGGHFNPTNCPHGAHVGDLLPLYARNGIASMYYYISGIDLNSLKGHTLIVHRHPDDFTTQPSGNSGEMIACGVIQ